MFRAFLYHREFEPRILEDRQMYDFMLTQGWQGTPNFVDEVVEEKPKPKRKRNVKEKTNDNESGE